MLIWHDIFILYSIIMIYESFDFRWREYAGIFAASNLCKNKNVQVTLVSDGPQLQLLQNIHRVASGELQPRDITLDIRGILGKDVIFVKGKSEKVDLVAKQAEIVLTESGMV